MVIEKIKLRNIADLSIHLVYKVHCCYFEKSIYKILTHLNLLIIHSRENVKRFRWEHCFVHTINTNRSGINNRVSPRRPQSFRYQRLPVDDCSPGRGGIAQDGEMDRCRESY